MRVRTFPLGPLSTNCYVLSTGKRAVVVDPGGPPASVLAFLRDQGLTLECIVNTHFHFDHILGNKALAEATGVPILASPLDAFLLETEFGGGGFMGLPVIERFAWEPLAPGEREFMGCACRVLATPGHSPGGLSLYFPDEEGTGGLVCVGDLLFKRSIGRTDFPGGDLEALLNAVVNEIFVLPDSVVVYPGHGPETTVADERNHNPFFQ